MPIPIAAALVASGALSALGNFFGSKSAAKSAQKAADTNLQLSREQIASNERLFHEARGSTGSAILPEYLKGFESSLGTDAAEVARALFGYGGGPTARLSQAEGMLQRYNPALEAGDNLVFDLASGKVGGDRRAALAPVLAARTGAAKGRMAAINQSLDETLAGLRAAKAGTGFRGMSTFDINRAQAATVGARTGAAEAMSQAELENALATQGMDESNLQMLLGALDLPFQRGQQRLAFSNLPISSVAGSYNDAMAPLNFFRLPVGNPPYANAPQVPVVPNSGQIGGAAVAGIGQSIGQYLAQQQMMQQLAHFFSQSRGGYGGGGVPISFARQDPGNMWA